MHLLHGTDRRHLMSIHQRSSVAVRFDLPIKHHEQLRHLVVSERRPASELLVDAVALLLRYHDVPGVPQPPVREHPVQQDQEVEVEEETPIKKGGTP